MTKKTTTKMQHHLQRYLQIASSIILIGLTAACSEDTGKQEISQKIEPQIKEETAKTPKSLPAPEEKTTENQIAEPTIPEQQKIPASENPVNNDQSDIQQQISRLENSLKDKNQDNETLRQHMEILLKKVKENQNLIQELEKSKANLPKK